MSSKSFGEWYESQKKDPVLASPISSSRSWIPSFLKSNQTSDVESSGLLSSVKNVKNRITETGDRIKETVVFGLLALLFFVLAYFIGIPTLLIRPAKFAISFTMGSLMTMLTMASIRGYSQYLTSLLQQEQLQTGFYLLSLVFTIYASIIRRSYMLTIVSSFLQIGVLIYYVSQSLPTGNALSLLFAAVKKVLIDRVCFTFSSTMALISKTTFWFYVAMFYKMSMIPFLLSPIYLVYELFTVDIRNDQGSFTVPSIMVVISILFLLLVAFIEYKPSVIRNILFESFIPNNQAFVNQHRLLIVFLRYGYLYLSVAMLSRYNFLEHKCLENTEIEAITCSAMSWEKVSSWIWFYPISLVLYFICAYYVKVTSDVKLL